MIQSNGKLIVSPEDKTKKHLKQSEWKKVAIVELRDDTCKYYQWFLKRRFGLEFINPLRGPHITIINDRITDIKNKNILEYYNKKRVNFEFDEKNIRSNGEHWWININIPEAEKIREKCGLAAKPYFGFHLTIGAVNEKNRAHSDYILECCKFFEL